MLDRVREMMEELGVEGEIIEHPGVDGRRSEDAASALGVPLCSVLKTLILIGREGPLAAVIRGCDRLSMKKLRKVSGAKRLRMARPEEVERITGFPVGGVPPFAPAALGMPRFVDEAVLSQGEVYGAAGSPKAGVRLDPSAFIELGFVAADIREGASE